MQKPRRPIWEVGTERQRQQRDANPGRDTEARPWWRKRKTLAAPAQRQTLPRHEYETGWRARRTDRKTEIWPCAKNREEFRSVGNENQRNEQEHAQTGTKHPDPATATE
jgi:hypothetical protein